MVVNVGEFSTGFLCPRTMHARRFYWVLDHEIPFRGRSACEPGAFIKFLKKEFGDSAAGSTIPFAS